MNLKKYKTKENLIILSVLIVFSIIWLTLFLNFSTLWGQDSFWYTRLAENMVGGKGYTLDGTTPHSQYPIGLPLLIAPFYFLLGNSAIGGLIMVFILSVASIILAYLIGKEVNSFVGISSAILLAFHNLFIFNSMSVMTETPFMFFSILGLYLFMKSYEKRNLIIPSIICICLSILIRYDGFFLAIPMGFYMLYRKKDFEDFFFSKKTFLAIGAGILILGSWFLRNLIAFGSPLVNAHSSGDGSLGLSISTIYQFLSFFFKTGYLFPFIVLLGITFVLFKIKSLKLKTFLLWIFVYVILHSWWWARGLRFYGQILILLCLFASIALFKIYEIFPKKKKSIAKALIFALVIIILAEQLFIFYSGSINRESTIYTLNRYDPIKQVSEYANQNLPDQAVYVFPEYVVYTNFLKKEQMTTYQSGLNHLFSTNQTIYLFTDNLHSWITDPFIPQNGIIQLSVPTQQGTKVKTALLPEEIKTFEFSNGKRIINATIWKIDGFHIIG